jgi:hypothetical protein
MWFAFSIMLSQVKQPFQDITDRILSNSALHCRTGRTIPSSLPPSSPPSASSHLPELKLDNYFTNNDQLSSLPVLSSGDEINRVPVEDGDIIDSDEDGDTFDPSDPFGFFAVEKKLKAQRVVVSNRNARTRYRSDSHTALPSPTKQIGKRNIIKFSEGVSPRTSPLPSTPSPYKPPASRTQPEASLSGENAEESGVIHMTSKGRRGTKSRMDESPNTLKASVKKIVKPKRPIRRAVIARKQSKAPNSGNDVEQDAPEGSKGRAMRNARKRGTAGRKPRERINEQEEALDCDSEELGVRSHLGLEQVV